MRQLKNIRFTVIAAAISAIPLASFAQQNTKQSLSDENALVQATVIVTATKREAVLTDVPLGISSVSGKALEARGVSTLEDLGSNSIGMNIIKTTPGENLLVSRGISTSQTLSIQSGPAVGVYVDEMPLAGLSSGVPDFGLWDVSRVEMLRGPQGTLYGEGAMAGTIRIISAAPDTNKMSSKFQLTGSSVANGSSGNSVRGMLNVPLSEGVAALRATVSYNKNPGWIDAPDLNQKNINTSKQTDSRLALRLTPSGALKIDASIWHQNSDAFHNNNQTSPGIYSPPALGLIGNSGVAPLANGQINTDSKISDMANLTVNYDFGTVNLVSATSYTKQNASLTVDARDTLPIALTALGVPASAVRFVTPNSSLLNSRERNLDMTSQELRLVSNSDSRFNWSFGGYFKKLDRHVDNSWAIHVPNLPLLDDSLVISDTSSKSMAFFGEGDWKLTDTVILTAGLRSYTDDRAATANVTNFSNVFGVPVGVYGPTKITEKKNTYNAILSWKPSDNMTLFARAASGFRSGGPNLWMQDPANIPKDFKAETIQSIEVGIKTNPAPWVVANAYLYSSDWKDKQVNLSTPNGLYDYLANSSTAKANGAEFELQMYPATGLSLSAALTYTDATITQNLRSSKGVLIAKSGSRLPYVSPWEIKTSADYRWPFADAKNGVANLTYIYRSPNFSDISNSTSSDNGSLIQANFRAGIEFKKKTWGIYCFIKNLTNSQSITTIQQAASAGYGVRYPSYIQPRTIGIEMQGAY